MSIDMTRYVPRFLLDDSIGAAMAAAIGAALDIFRDAVTEGILLTLDTASMPEWRLDEMAWELGCLYDYTADVESKRAWIENATEDYAKYGTAAAIERYLSGVFETVSVEEAGRYGGDPFHFRVIVTGEYTEESNAWALKAIGETKNVRSVLDNLLFNGGTSTADFFAAAAVQAVEIEDNGTAAAI